MHDRLRNLGIIAHVDAGKTTLTERILYFSGGKHKAGEVDAGTTTTDSDILERQKGITINAAAVSVVWDGVTINLIDTPGHVDFTAEVERSLRVLDGAVGVFCAVGGVEVQSESVWFQARKYGVPCLAFVNKLDRMGADFAGCVAQLRTKLGIVPAMCAIPVGQAGAFRGVIDLIGMRWLDRDPADASHRRFMVAAIPADHAEEAARCREALLATAALADDDVAAAILEEREVSETMLRTALRRGTLAGTFTPVCCGSAKNYHGVELLLDAVLAFLPSPLERPPVRGVVPGTNTRSERPRDAAQPLTALAFKTITEPDGEVVYLRVYAGALRPGVQCLNTTTGKTERVARIYRMHGNARRELPVAGPGEIVGVVGLKHTGTGHTLCDPAAPLALEAITFPRPVIGQALVPAPRTDPTKLAEALARLTRDDPTLKFHTDEETNQLILSGMGELHLDVAVEKLQRHAGVRVTAGQPKVAYRLTLARPVVFETRYVRQTGGPGQYAIITMRYEPLTPERAAELGTQAQAKGGTADANNLYFADETVGGAVPRAYIPAVADGFRRGAARGEAHPYPFVDVLATLVDGRYHANDSSAEAFAKAAWESFRTAQATAGVIVLEPIMRVVIHAPEAALGALGGDVIRRRGAIRETSTEANRATITAEMPLANLFGYLADLRRATSGAASFGMEFSHYAPSTGEG